MTWLRSALFNAFFFGFSATYSALLLPLAAAAPALAAAPIRPGPGW